MKKILILLLGHLLFFVSLSLAQPVLTINVFDTTPIHVLFGKVVTEAFQKHVPTCVNDHQRMSKRSTNIKDFHAYFLES